MGNQCVPFIKLSSCYTCTPREELAHGRSYKMLLVELANAMSKNIQKHVSILLKLYNHCSVV